MPYERLIDRLVELAEKAHRDQNQSDFANSSDILKGAVIGAKGSKGSKGAMGSKGSKF